MPDRNLTIAPSDAKPGSSLAKAEKVRKKKVHKKRKEATAERKKQMRAVLAKNRRKQKYARERKKELDRRYDGSTPLENQKEELFVMYLLSGLSGRQAYLRVSGNPKTHCSGQQYLAKDRVQKRLSFKRHELDVLRTARIEKNLQSMMDVAYMDPADFVEEDSNKVKRVHDMPIRARGAIAGLKFDEGEVSEIKCADRNKAQENIARSIGQFDNKDDEEDNKVQHVVINFNDIKVANINQDGQDGQDGQEKETA